MITLNNYEKRWLEIIFYLLCKKIFSINTKQQDIIDFINGFRWTNLYKYDILIDALQNQKILLNPEFIPSKHEFLITLEHPECRLRIHKTSVWKLTDGTNYTFRKRDRYHAAMKEEINKTEIFPKLNIPNIHETIYSFLTALRYIADIVKTIKF